MGWRDAPLVSPKAGSWRDAPLVDEEPVEEKPKWSGQNYLDAVDPRTPTGRAGLASIAALGGVAVAGPAAIGGAAKAVGGAALKTLANPVVAGGLGAYEGYKSGGIPGALYHGLMAAATGQLIGKAGRWGRVAKIFLPAAEAAEAAPAATAAATVAKEAAPVAKAAANTIQATVKGDKVWAVLNEAGNPVQVFRSASDAVKGANAMRAAASAAPTVAKAVTTVTEAAPTVAKAAETLPAAATATRQSALVQFAQDVAAKNPKLGEKIWIALDKAGNPVKLLTPDQAAAAKRAGIATTWVKNLWR